MQHIAAQDAVRKNHNQSSSHLLLSKLFIIGPISFRSHRILNTVFQNIFDSLFLPSIWRFFGLQRRLVILIVTSVVLSLMLTEVLGICEWIGGEEYKIYRRGDETNDRQSFLTSAEIAGMSL